MLFRSPPASGLKVPEAHDTQFPAGPVKPGAHWHALRPTPPSGATALVGHSSHTKPASVLARNSGAQSSHCAALVLAFADVWPAAHGRHRTFAVVFL